MAMRPDAPRPGPAAAADPTLRLRLGVGVAVRDAAGRILLERRRDNGLWGLPGGRVEPGESVAQAAVREVWEETGLAVRVARLVGVYSEPDGRIVTYPDNGDVRHLVDVVVEAAILGGSLRASEESEALRFFAPGEVPADLAPPARVPLADILHGLTGILR